MINRRNFLRQFSAAGLILSIFFTVYGFSGKEKLIIVKNRKTDYCIFLGSDAPESVKIAAEDLKNYFKKVTGVSPQIVLSGQIPSIPFISLGYNIAAKKAGFDVSGIPTDGYRLVTLNKNIYIYGNDTPDGEVNKKGGITKGTSNGVYTFIEDYLGVRWLMPGEIGEEYPEIKTLVVSTTDRIEYSPFDFRILLQGNKGSFGEWNRRLKLGKVSPLEHGHNWAPTVPPTLFEDHPEWFAMIDSERVPPVGSNYKLETTNQELVQYYADKIIETFRKDSLCRWYSLSPSDGSGWSESPESKALTELDTDSALSITPLILTFYNDVARIVRKEFPDHMLGGYLYSLYSCPPSTVFPIEPNLTFVLANTATYGFNLYKPSLQESWGEARWIPQWSELSKKYGFDLYYYDLPNALVQPNGIICPPAPDLLNITFSGLVKYGFKGAFIWGPQVWPSFAADNYTLAKLLWNPGEDANEILKEFCKAAYGSKSGIYIEKLFHVLDTAYSSFYNRNPKMRYRLTEQHLKEIYAPNYKTIEEYYLKANSIKKNTRQQKRLELFGQVLSILQWNLRDYGYLPSDYTSPLSLTSDEIDKLLINQVDECWITQQVDYKTVNVVVDQLPPLPGSGNETESIVPVNRTFNMLLHVPADGEVSISIEKFNKRAEFIQYILSDEGGEKILTGAVSEGRIISFKGKSGTNYFLNIVNQDASALLRVKGASVAYNIPPWRGLTLDGDYMDKELNLYFYVPKVTNSFNIKSTVASADIFSPDGREIGKLNNSDGSTSEILIAGNDVKVGFYKLVIKKFSGRKAILEIDDQLPQWFITNPAQPLKITDY